MTSPVNMHLAPLGVTRGCVCVLPAGVAAWGHVAPTPLARRAGDQAAPIVLPAPGALSVLIALGRLDRAPVVRPIRQRQSLAMRYSFLEF
jgi:hypothetical protein